MLNTTHEQETCFAVFPQITDLVWRDVAQSHGTAERRTKAQRLHSLPFVTSLRRRVRPLLKCGRGSREPAFKELLQSRGVGLVGAPLLAGNFQLPLFIKIQESPDWGDGLSR